MAHADSEHHGHHIIPLKLLLTVFAALVALTVITVLTAKFVDLGPLNFPLAISIALLKASLVVGFFMALHWDNKVNALILAIGCIFVVVFLVFTMFDTNFRGDADNTQAIPVEDQIRMEEELRAREAGEAVSAGEAHSEPAESN